MIIQLTDAHSCHGCRVIETKVLRPPAHTCVCAGSPQEAVSQFLGTETTCPDLCNTCICVCMRWQVTDANGTAQAKFSFNFSHWCWALGQGILTFYNTHVCVHGRAKLLSQFSVRKNINLIPALHKGIHDHSTKPMFTDATVAALLEPRSSDLQHTHVCAGSPQEAISFWKRKQDLSGLCNTRKCL